MVTGVDYLVLLNEFDCLYEDAESKQRHCAGDSTLVREKFTSLQSNGNGVNGRVNEATTSRDIAGTMIVHYGTAKLYNRVSVPIIGNFAAKIGVSITLLRVLHHIIV